MALPDTVPKSQLGPKLCPTKPNTGLLGVAARTKASHASDLATEFLVTKKDLAPIYMSPCPYFDAFEEEINLQKFDLDKHRTAGPGLALVNGCLFLVGMAPGTPGAENPMLAHMHQRRVAYKGWGHTSVNYRQSTACLLSYPTKQHFTMHPALLPSRKFGLT